MKGTRLLIAVAVALSLSVLPAQAADCQFVLGFASLKALIDEAEGSDKVGDCLEDQHSNPINGDALQQTTGGLMVWRKLDNWTAFTDGHRTWINGPHGLQARLNTEQFAWEGEPETAPTPVPSAVPVIVPTPTPTPTTASTPVPTPTLTYWEGVKAEAGTIDYKELFRNSEQYVGQNFYFRGKIVQVIEHGRNIYDFRVNVATSGSDVVYIQGYRGQRLLDGDRIEFVGRSAGLQRYTSIFKQSITIPKLIPIAVRLIDDE